MVAWSYSSIKLFDQCPKKYYHLRVAKDVKDDMGDAALYGDLVHKAAEAFIKDGTPIPEEYAYMRPFVERLAALEGEKHAEIKMGVRKTPNGYEPCGFFDRDVWWRGIADLLVINGGTAWLVDYKTGKSARYADTKQLDLLAAATMVHFPQVVRVKSALLFVIAGALVDKKHLVTERDELFSIFDPELHRLDAALESGVWNPKSGPLCGWCPVEQCHHHRPRR